MALPATHVSFALDLESRLAIQDRTAYYTGSLYPDSRYFTGTAREVTHGPACPRDPFLPGLTDFERGWATHLLYDEEVSERLKPMIPETYPRTRESGGFDPWWLYLTAMKTIEDQQSMARGAHVLSAMQCVADVANPNGEDKDRLRSYYALVRGVYRAIPNLDDYHALMSQLRVPAAQVDAWIELVNLLQMDNRVCGEIGMMYPAFLEKIADRAR